jgi:hypothetical protein
MRKYTAIYTSKRKQLIKQTFEAKGTEAAINHAKSFDAWPNVVIFDDTYAEIQGYGEMIYMNGQIIKRSFDGPYLMESLSIYDAIRTDLSYTSRRVSNKISAITGKPSTVQFVKDICVALNKLSSLCQAEAAKNNEPCRWL